MEKKQADNEKNTINLWGGVERNFAFDIIKTLAIFWVITYHFYFADIDVLSGQPKAFFNFFMRVFMGCHVPLFFTVNGALLFSKPLDLRKHVKKTIRLIVLTIIWCAITLLIMSFIKAEPLSLEEFLYQLKTWENGWIQHLWFLQQLCVIYILFPLLKSAYDTSNAKGLIAFFAVAGTMSFGNAILTRIINVISCISLGTVWSLTDYNFLGNFNIFASNRSMHLFYFIFGGLFVNKYNQIILKRSQKILVFIVLLCSAICNAGYGILLSFTNGKVISSVGNNYASPFTVITVICIVLLLKGIQPTNRYITNIITLISKNTLGIYLLHMFVGLIFKNVFNNGEFKGSFKTYIASSIILAISLICTIGMKKIPILKGLFKL